LLFATFEGCGYLCDIHGEILFGECGSCPGNTALTDNHEGFSSFRQENSVCVVHEHGYITKPEIALQCWAEIDRRIQKEGSKK
jgi:hypothetical protein